jgi:preprotein translocase subunit SecB
MEDKENVMDDRPNQRELEDKGTTSSSIKPIALQTFAVQMIDIFPVEIVARRFPVAVQNISAPISVQFNIADLGVNPENLQAQVTLDVKVASNGEPGLFEIQFKLVAIFTYSPEYTQEMVGQFLHQGSLSLMLPFARELVLSLSTRLRLPPIILSLVQLSSPSVAENE